MHFFKLAAALFIPALALASPAPIPAAKAAHAALPSIADLLGKLNLITNITLLIDINTAPITNEVSTSFFAKNSLPDLGYFGIDIVFSRVTAKALNNGTVYGTFDYTFNPPFRVPAGKSASSPVIPHVNLTQGFEKSLGLLDLPVQQFDLQTTSAVGFAWPWLPALPISLGYNQKAIPFSAALTF